MEPPSPHVSTSIPSDVKSKFYNVSRVDRILTPCWSHLVASGDTLVTSSGSRKELAFWNKAAGKGPWTPQSITCLGEGISQIVSWYLQGHHLKRVLITGTWEGSVFILDNNGNILLHHPKAHKEGLIDICMWNDCLVTADLTGIIKIWNIDFRTFKISLIRSLEHSSKVYSLLSVNTVDKKGPLCAGGYAVAMWDSHFLKSDLQAPRRRNLVTCLTQWKGWIVTGCMDGTVSLWNCNGHLEKQIECSDYIGNLMEWREMLCVGMLTKIQVLNDKGHCVAEVEGSHNMTVLNGELVTNSDSEILMYRRTLTWSIARLLWIGWMKGLPEECHLSILPAEMVQQILLYV